MAEVRLLVLGAGRHQDALIRRAEMSDVRTVAVDPYPDAPGKSSATWSEDADALDVEAMTAVARKHRVHGVVTVGTDQTVVSMAHVAEACGLPCHLTPQAAIAATNKSAMRDTLMAAEVPMASGVAIGPDDDVTLAKRLDMPVVVKPADSQGQRGTSKVFDRAGLDTALSAAREASRTRTAVIEEFAVGPEVTINAWVHSNEATVLSVTDRVTFNPPPVVGICLQHIHPSRHVDSDGQAADIATAVARAYGMSHGPLYIQAIASSRGLVVMEAAARVGGGHEMSLLPLVVGADVIDRSIDLALDRRQSQPPAPQHRTAGLVNFVVARPGTVSDVEPMTLLRDEGLIAEGDWYRPSGFEQLPITNSMGRVGYFITVAPDRRQLLARASEGYQRLRACDPSGENLVFWPDAELLLGG